jgi:uncharacterized membrane protein
VLSLRQSASRHLLAIFYGLLIIGLIVLLPDFAPAPAGQGDAVTAVRAEIVSIEQAPAGNEGLPPVPKAKVRILDGADAGQIVDAYLSGPSGSQIVSDYRPGEEVVLTTTKGPDSATPYVAVSDRWRIPKLELLALIFAAAVVVVGGWRGVRALVALGLTIAVILKILLPLLIAGIAPVPLAVLAASAITIVTITLTEGWGRSSLAAILGTTGALALTGLLAAAATAAMGFTYTAGSDLAFYTTSSGQGLDLRGFLLAAMILGAVGVLDDISVTQATLVEELAERGNLAGRNLISSGMGIGRSHIGATVNTLFLAYVGAGLPLLVVVLVSHQPAALVFNDEEVATEIVRTLVGSLGIVAAVPLTTVIAASLAADRLAQTAGAARTAGGTRTARRSFALPIVGLAIVGTLVATAVLPLTSGPRTPLTPSVLGPSASIPPPAPSGTVGAAPSAAAGEPEMIDRGQAVPVVVGGQKVGKVAIVKAARIAAPSGKDRVTMTASYIATSDYQLADVIWEVLLPDGTEVPFDPADDPAALDRTLASGDTAEVRFDAVFDHAADTPFVVYLDGDTQQFLYALPLD